MPNMRVLATAFLALFAIPVLSGCALDNTYVRYAQPEAKNLSRISVPVKGAVIPTADLRENTKMYPKQIIRYTGYYDDNTFEINDKAVADMFDEALSMELFRLGVGLTRIQGIEGPLDRENKQRVRDRLMQEYPDVKVAFGIKVNDFFATTKRNLLSTDVSVKAKIEFYALDVETGEMLWSDYGTEWEDTVAWSDREELVEKLNESLDSLMRQTVRDNLSLRDMLVKIGYRT